MSFHRLHCLVIYVASYLSVRGVRGQVIRAGYLESLTPHNCGFVSRRGIWILSCQKAIQLAYGTSVVLLRCPIVPEITRGFSPQVKLESRHITFTVLILPEIICSFFTLYIQSCKLYLNTILNNMFLSLTMEIIYAILSMRLYIFQIILMHHASRLKQLNRNIH